MIYVTIPLDNVTATPNGIRFKYLDGNISQSTHSAILELPFLPVKARRVHLFYTIELGSLLSIGIICDASFTAYFNAKKVYIFFQGKMFLQ